MTDTVRSRDSATFIAEVNEYCARNYAPLPVVVSHAEGAWVWDVEGKKYLDCLAAYSAVNQGHMHPAIVRAAKEQLERLALTSRAFHNDQMGPFLKRLCDVTGYQKALPMNTGAEAVETAIKAARRWAYRVKGVPQDRAEIIVCENNFHGRTTTIISFSTDTTHNADYGPPTPGFKVIPFGDAKALRAAITRNTAAFLFEPIQGEGGVIIPPAGYIAEVAAICRDNRVLLAADEIQTGFGRTGKLFCCDWEDVRPDVVMVGKALSGGLYPVSAMLSDAEIMGVFAPGDHGSTYGGNPLGAAIARAAIDVIVDERLAERAQELGTWLLGQLRKIESPYVADVRGKGLMIAIEIKREHGTAHAFCLALKERGVLAKETHEQVIRLAPPLIIARDDLAWALEQVQAVLEGPPPRTR